MEWKAPFVVYRLTAETQFTQVFETDDLTKAKYWLNYIAEIGDVLTRSPIHPKNSSGLPEYFCHKVQSGKSLTDKEQCLKMLSLSDFGSLVPKE